MTFICANPDRHHEMVNTRIEEMLVKRRTLFRIESSCIWRRIMQNKTGEWETAPPLFSSYIIVGREAVS